MFIINAPFVFSAVWAVVKNFVDEKTQKKINIVSSSYTKSTLLEHVEEDQLAEFLGGKNTANLIDDVGPWSDWEVVDGANKDDVVGVRKKGETEVVTPDMVERLPNPDKLSEKAQAGWQEFWANRDK